MTRSMRTPLLFVAALFVASAIGAGVIPVAGFAPAPARAPHLVHGPVGAVPTIRTVAPPAAHPTTSARVLGAAPTPSSGPCNTPGGSASWNTANFFTDASVTFFTPDSPQLSGANFQTEPCQNIIPTYTNGFWMNVSTDVVLSFAYVTIWGTQWPTPGQTQTDLKGFAASTPTVLPMNIEGPFYNKATFFFNDYRYFWPGSEVYFNITLSSTAASPSTIYSASTSGNHWAPYNWVGGVDNYTWSFYVASPFSPTQSPGKVPVNFSNVIDVSTTPSVFGTPAFEPNPKQTIQITLTARNISTGGAAIAIPMAQGSFTISGGNVGTGVYFENFGPSNHTVMQLTQPLGPYPDSEVQFNITAWLPWEGGGIDFIYSTVYKFNWSSNGGWWDPTGALEGNLALSTSPDLFALGSAPVLATGTAVNISIHEPIENVTIASATLHFRYADSAGVSYGNLPMTLAGDNTSYVWIAGLPPGGGIVFSVAAKDIYGNPVSSGNYSYTESGAIGPPVHAGYGLFFFEAIDLATGQLVPGLNFTVANDTWSESSNGYALGFANPMPVGGAGFLPVAFGTYVVTVHAFGESQSWTGTVADQNPFTVVFYLTSGPVATEATSPPPAYPIAAIVGIGVAAVAMIPISAWFRERRRKAEAEQRRITL
jgi:hypothetical protein